MEKEKVMETIKENERANANQLNYGVQNASMENAME